MYDERDERDKRLSELNDKIAKILKEKEPGLLEHFETQREFFYTLNWDEKLEFLFGAYTGLQAHIKKLEAKINGV
jgi:hypothetical protein